MTETETSTSTTERTETIKWALEILNDTPDACAVQLAWAIEAAHAHSRGETASSFRERTFAIVNDAYAEVDRQRLAAGVVVGIPVPCRVARTALQLALNAAHHGRFEN